MFNQLWSGGVLPSNYIARISLTRKHEGHLSVLQVQVGEVQDYIVPFDAEHHSLHLGAVPFAVVSLSSS